MTSLFVHVNYEWGSFGIDILSPTIDSHDSNAADGRRVSELECCPMPPEFDGDDYLETVWVAVG